MFRLRVCGTLLLVLVAAGCGTTKWSDSPRTATEQLLISDSVDRAISEIDFSALEDHSVYLDTRYIATTLDQNYVTSTLRQHMLASGCIIKDRPDDADYIVEVRTGSLGTNRNDVLVGVPATQLPTVGLFPAGAAAIPEIALSKRTSQQAVCKIAVFAYDRMSGRPVWQSGNRKVASSAKDTWLLGTGPFQRGNIYEGTAFAGEKLRVPLTAKAKGDDSGKSAGASSVGQERTFELGVENLLDDAKRVGNASYNEPVSQDPPTATPAAQPLPVEPPPPGTEPSDQPSPNAGAQTTAPVQQKAAYTPPVSEPVAAQPTGPGPQGNLTQQSIAPVTNPAITTAGAVQSYNLAKQLLDKH